MKKTPCSLLYLTQISPSLVFKKDKGTKFIFYGETQPSVLSWEFCPTQTWGWRQQIRLLLQAACTRTGWTRHVPKCEDESHEVIFQPYFLHMVWRPYGHFGHKWPYGHFFPVKTYGPKSSFGKFPSVYPMNIKKVPANGNSFKRKIWKLKFVQAKLVRFLMTTIVSCATFISVSVKVWSPRIT